MTAIDVPMLRSRIEDLGSIPSMPAILMPVLRQLEEPVERLDLERIIDLVSHDKALAAQVLRMANTSLFGRWNRIDSIRSAVVTLGIARLREIVTECCMLQMAAQTTSKIDPTVFWEHSLATALVSRRVAKKLGLPDPEKAYLAGLLHDIGLTANLLLIPDQFEAALARAAELRIPLDWAEAEIIGIDHAITGSVLADHWKLGPDLCEVIHCHHKFETAVAHKPLVAVINVADLLCRVGLLGYGYEEDLPPDFAELPAWQLLAQSFTTANQFDLERFTSELSEYVKEVRTLISVLFRTQ
jgi:putative nucleotidyltransferase with HDIG domain